MRLNLYELIKIMKADLELDIRWDKYITRFKQFRNTFRNYFKKQVEDYIKQVDNMAEFQYDIKKFKLKKLNQEERIEAITDELEKIVILWNTSINELALEELSPEQILAIDSKSAREFARTEAWRLIRWINETTEKLVQQIIDKWLEKQLSKKWIKEMIADRFRWFAERRATLIARQEVAMAFEKAKNDQFKKYEKEYWIEWYKRAQTQQDEKVRPSHSQNQADWWIPRNQRFSWTWDMHAPFGFNCRCVTSYRLRKPNN